ncbi:MAG TPA: AarF/UbiB family protein, partial [Polyangiaceae bacterium]
MAKGTDPKRPASLTPEGTVVQAKSRPPTSRLGRLARLGALSTHALPLAFEGAKRALRTAETDPEVAREKMLSDARKAANAMLKTLGEMKGVPLKLGQMASYIDGLAPPGYEEKFQKILAKLQEKAPPLSPEAASRVVLEDLGAPPEQIFAQWERQPFAAASIGQVHQAVTRGGDSVAVKVQYPGIDKAIENDLKSLS